MVVPIKYEIHNFKGEEKKKKKKSDPFILDSTINNSVMVYR